jgi:hypothetical protein
MNMLEVIVKGADQAARHDDPSAAPQTPTDPPGRSPKLAALVARNGPQDHFVGLRPTAPCPFCGADPPLAAAIAGRFIVGCESDDCHVNPQVSGANLGEAWARWNRRHVARQTGRPMERT